MNRFATRIGASRWARSLPGQIAAAVAAGLLVSALAYVALDAATHTNGEDAPRATVATLAIPGSLAVRISSGKVAVAAPPQGAEALLAQTQPGDRLDIIAVFPATAIQPALSATIVRGAVVIDRPPDTSGSPAVLEVSPEEAVVLTHIVQSGTHVVYALWPSGGSPPALPLLDAAAIRSRFGQN